MSSKLTPRHSPDSGSTHAISYGQLRALLASCAFLILVSFAAGYFWGVGSSVEQLSTQLDQEAFSDQISASLMPMQTEETEEDDEQGEPLLDEIADQEVAIEEEGQQVSAEHTYHAQLAGFGNKESAQRFAQKLIKKKIPVIVNAVHTKTNRGKSITWYQVVTESYSTKEELVALVEQLKETERLKDPQIVYC